MKEKWSSYLPAALLRFAVYLPSALFIVNNERNKRDKPDRPDRLNRPDRPDRLNRFIP